MTHRTTNFSKLTSRWVLITSVAITLFWTFWFLVNGNVPTVSGDIFIGKTLSYTFPFELSRWWDILLGPLYSLVFVLVFFLDPDREKEYRSETERPESGLGILAGIIVGIICVIFLYLSPFAGASMGPVLLLGLVFTMIIGPSSSRASATSLGLILSLFAGLSSGLVILGLILVWILICTLIS